MRTCDTQLWKRHRPAAHCEHAARFTNDDLAMNKEYIAWTNTEPHKMRNIHGRLRKPQIGGPESV